MIACHRCSPRMYFLALGLGEDLYNYLLPSYVRGLLACLRV